MPNPNPSFNWYLDLDGALEIEPILEIIETDSAPSALLRVPRSLFQAEDWQLLAPPEEIPDAQS